MFESLPTSARQPTTIVQMLAARKEEALFRRNVKTGNPHALIGSKALGQPIGAHTCISSNCRCVLLLLVGGERMGGGYVISNADIEIVNKVDLLYINHMRCPC